MQMKLASDIDPQKGFTLEHGGYSKSQQKNNMKAKRYFIPPCTIRYDALPRLNIFLQWVNRWVNRVEHIASSAGCSPVQITVIALLCVNFVLIDV